jgi:hypothetical protein
LQGKKFVAIPEQVNEQKYAVAKENNFIVGKVARVIYVYCDHGGVEG